MFAAFAECESGIRKAAGVRGLRGHAQRGRYQSRRPKLTDKQQAELKWRFEAGENHSQLARAFGIDRVTVHRYCACG